MTDNEIRPQDLEYPILPKHINTAPGVHFYNSFGSMEAEITAKWVVKFCQAVGTGWLPFSYRIFNNWCQAAGHIGDVWLNGLDKRGYLTGDDTALTPTHEFVCKCFAASPAIRRVQG